MLRPVSPAVRPGAGQLMAAIVLAAGLNCLRLDVVEGARVFIGGFVIMPFVLSWPPLWAVAAAMLAMLPSVVTLGHPFALGLSGAEAVWLVLGIRYFRGNAILMGAAFWILAGLPLGLWWHAGLGGMPRDLALVVLATRAATDLAAIATGYFILRYTTFGGRLSGEPADTPTVREVIFNYVFVLSLVPLASVALGFSVLSREAAESDARERVIHATRNAVRQIDLFFELHQSALAGIADVLVSSPALAPRLLEETRQAHPRFVTMLMTDAAGRILRTAPPEHLARLAGSSVADREYFRVARDTRRPFVSGVFRGRGFGNDILVAISVPLFDSAGAFAGIVEASVQVDRLAQAAAAVGEQDEIQFILADSSGRVIHADPLTGLQSLQPLQDSALAPALTSKVDLTPFLADRIEPDGTKHRVSNRAQRCRTVGFIVVAQWPVLRALEGMKTAYGLMLVILVGIAGSAALVARAAHRRLSAPLEFFSGHTARQTQAGAIALTTPPDRETPREVNAVFGTFNHLAVRLNEAHAELVRHNAELDRRVAERTREAETARQQAEAANRSKTEFLAMTSHEIRTPLNAIIGLADAVAAEPLAAASPARLHTIRDSGTRLLGVVNDLLDLSRAEAGKLELHPAPVELGALCGDLRGLFALRAQQQETPLEFLPPAQSPLWVQTDAPRLQQVLINLVGNALKFAREGRVTLRVELQRALDREVEIRFAVRDTGPGMSAEEQARLFQPYVQLPGAARAAEPGSGLGLSISRRLVALLGGELALRSAPEQGTEFYFTLTLPRATPAAPAASATPAAAGPSEAANLRLLAADDNRANQEVLQALLEPHCRQVVIVSSGGEALRALTEGKFDVALIDLEMPDLDGLEVARVVHSWRGTEASRGCRLVAFSAHGRSQMWERCAGVGFDDFVEKPIDRRELWRALTTRSTLTTPPA